MPRTETTEGKFKSKTALGDARARIIHDARDARLERARVRALTAAVCACQRLRRRGVAKRDAGRRAVEEFDGKFGAVSVEALPSDDDVCDVMIPILLAHGDDIGTERLFRALAIVLTRVDAVVERCVPGVVARAATLAVKTCGDARVRKDLPSLAMCGVKLACALCERVDWLSLDARVHRAACEALTEIVSDVKFAHRAAVTQALAPLVVSRRFEDEIGDDDAAFDVFAVRLMRVPDISRTLPAKALQVLEQPKALRRVLRASLEAFDSKENVIAHALNTIENAVTLLYGHCQKCIKGRESSDNAHTVLLIADLCAAASRKRETQRDVSAGVRDKARAWTGILNEPSFVLGLIGERQTDSSTWCVCSPINAGILAKAYDAILESAQEPSFLSRVFSTDSSMSIYSVCAFTPGFLNALWKYLGEQLSIATALTLSDVEQPDMCIAKAFLHGAEQAQADVLRCFRFFCATYAHALVVLRDAQFFDEQTLFSLDEQRAIVVAVNTLVVRSHTTHKSGFADDWTKSLSSLVKFASILLRSLVTRDSRQAFCSSIVWTAPNSEQNALIPEVVATRFQQSDAGDAGLLQDAPSSLTFATRVKIFRELIVQDRDRAKFRPQAGGIDAGHNDIYARAVAEIPIRRESVLEDALATILPLGSKARGRMLVKYVNIAGEEEAGIDAGGLFKELLSEVTELGLDPNRGLFETNGTSGIFPSPRASDTQESLLLLELMGMMVGKALYEGILQDINLAPFFAAKILGVPRTIDDIASLDEELHRGCVQILEYDGNVADLCLDFTVSEEVYGQIVTKELIRDGENIEVNNENRRVYVHALADYYLNRRLAVPMRAFMTGLTKIINKRWLSLFTVKELQLLLNGGEAPMDVDDWEKHTLYSGGYTARSTVVRNFWRTMRKFSPSQRRDVLKFVTSSPRPPLQGFKHLNPPFVIHKVNCAASPFAYFGAADVSRLPSASTCFNMLKLPNYRRLATLEKSVKYAVESRAGFELS